MRAPVVFASCLAALCATAVHATCGNATLPLDPTRKNVLIIGDSISMTPPYTPGGYGHALEQLLTAQGIAVQHAGGDYSGGQAGDTRNGLICTDPTGPGYLNFSGTFDLIHFNYGLHDLANYSSELPPLPLGALAPRNPCSADSACVPFPLPPLPPLSSLTSCGAFRAVCPLRWWSGR